MKTTNFVFILLTSLSFLIYSCGKNDTNKFEHAGGTFVFALSNDPATFIARDVSDLYSAILINQVLEGLVLLNPKTLKPEPCIAESWEISEDGLTIKFNIREGIYFHSHELIGDNRVVTPEDIKYSIELACKKPQGKDPSTAYSSIYKNVLVGAKRFHNGEEDEIKGIKLGENSITLQLAQRDVNFLDKLTSASASIVCKELVENDKEAELIGTGPFKYDKYLDEEENRKIILLRNEKYYLKDNQGNQLPYLDSIVYIVEGRSLAQLEMFEDGVTHLIDKLPPSRIVNMLEGRMDDFNSTPPRLMLRRKPLLATQYYQFNLLNEAFKDVRVRKAINYAVDKEDIVQNIINNQAYGIGDAGIVPPSAFPGYDSEGVKKHGYTYNPIKARELLAEAGYPNGEGFPTITLKFNLGTVHSAVADRFASQMKRNLNINVNIDGLPFEDRIRDQINANGDIFRTTWFADYYSPETFLLNAYGATVPDNENEPSMVNHARYKNEAFDVAFEAGQKSDDIMERYKHFAEAEKIMMDEAPFIILWYEETIKIAYSKVRNLHLNEMNHYYFRDVYLKEWTKEEYEAKKKKEQ